MPANFFPENTIGYNNLVSIFLVCSCLLISCLLKTHRVKYLTEPAAFIFLGLFLGLLLAITKSSTHQYINFNPEIFFYYLLPPIIFESGFNLRKVDFFSHFSKIALFALLGTCLSTALIGLGLCALLNLRFLPLTNYSEAFLFSAILSAVDPLAVLSILPSNSENSLLSSLIYGESLLNDSISILFYKALEKHAIDTMNKSSLHFSSYLLYFAFSFVGSFVIGVVMALLSSLVAIITFDIIFLIIKNSY